MTPRFLYGDVSCTARAALKVPEKERPMLIQALFAQAEEANLFVKRYGRVHPSYGNGSLMAAARKQGMVSEPTFGNLEYCKVLMLVLQAILARYDTTAFQNRDCNRCQKGR